jgi:endonuclease YncB( thermonuclease family)
MIVSAADFSGRVVGVIDGDTLEVLHNRHPERIRLSGIDRPEKGHAFGNRAKQAISAGTPHMPTSAPLIMSPTRASRLGRSLTCCRIITLCLAPTQSTWHDP